MPLTTSHPIRKESTGWNLSAIFSAKLLKILSPIVLICCLSLQTASAVQADIYLPCCGQDYSMENAPDQEAIAECLMLSPWIEQFDDQVASSYRVLRFMEQGVLEMTTVFRGYTESEVTHWQLYATDKGIFLTIDDPVLREQIIYQLKTTDLGIQLYESGLQEEAIKYYPAPLPSIAAY